MISTGRHFKSCAALQHAQLMHCSRCTAVMLVLLARALPCLFPAGLFEGVPVSIITTLMGMPNMDFVVREARAAVSGHMAIVRLGTCGALRPPARLGSFMVASPGAVCVRWVDVGGSSPGDGCFWRQDGVHQMCDAMGPSKVHPALQQCCWCRSLCCAVAASCSCSKLPVCASLNAQVPCCCGLFAQA